MIDYTNHECICRFGIARRDITPPVGIYHRMWGAAAHDRSENVHRPLTATAVTMRPVDDADALQVIVAVDHCLLFHPEMETLLERVSTLTGVARDNLIVTFSHTHAAGLMEESRSHLPGGEEIPEYLQRVAAEIGDAVRESINNLEPATLTCATGRCSLAAHRDLWDAASGQFVCGFNPDGEADDTVLVIRACNESGDIIATLVNYACHPTTLAWDNRLISPDFVGAMRETIEHSTDAPCVFLQGAAGDVGPREGFVGDVEIADRNGRELGFAALSALQSMGPPQTRLRYAGPVISGATIGTWERTAPTNNELTAMSVWQRDRWTIPLPYRSDLPTVDDVRDELQRFESEEHRARDAGEIQKAADARAMVERRTRRLARLTELPLGEAYPYPVTVLRLGRVLWVFVEGEPYNILQRNLREQFPDFAVAVVELANGSRIGYLPTADTFGKGIYQETIAYLDHGALETLTVDLVNRIDV